MIRILDIFFSIMGLLFFLPVLPFIFLIVHMETGSAIFCQLRVGQNQKEFLLYKFRTMKLNTPTKPTHFISKKNVTKFGNFLRTSKLDEILQLYNVLLGNMSLVGPRPCLLQQKKLIAERHKRGVFKVKPGITGLAQIKGINMKNPTLLAQTDLEMIKRMDLAHYFYIICKSLLIGFRKNTK